VIKIILGNVFSKIETSDTKLISALVKKYTRRPPGYQYTPQYKYRGDAGDKSFVDKQGNFGTGLRHSIYKDLNHLGLEFEVDDNRDKPVLETEDLEGIELREYQQALVELALEKRGCIVKAPTGAGKTFIMASILSSLKDKTGVIFFTRKQLLIQTYETLKGLGFDVGVCFGDGVDIKPITLCTAQSVDKILDTHVKESDFILFDEVHEFSNGKVTSAITRSFPKASVRIGFTATPPTNEYQLLNLVSFLGPVVSEVDVSTLVDKGFLSQAEITMFDLGDDPDNDDYYKSYQEIYSEYITNGEKRNEVIRKIAQKSCDSGGKVLILVQSLSHADELSKILPDSLVLQGKDDISKRKKTIKEFTKKGGSILIGTVIMQTGIDIPEITHFINARGLKSDIATIQAMGRSLRIHDSKSKVFIYDFYDNKPILRTHAKKRLRSYKKLGFKVNKVCYQTTKSKQK